MDIRNLSLNLYIYQPIVRNVIKHSFIRLYGQDHEYIVKNISKTFISIVVVYYLDTFPCKEINSLSFYNSRQK